MLRRAAHLILSWVDPIAWALPVIVFWSMLVCGAAGSSSL